MQNILLVTEFLRSLIKESISEEMEYGILTLGSEIGCVWELVSDSVSVC